MVMAQEPVMSLSSSLSDHFLNLKQTQFTGKLRVKSGSGRKEWVFYMFMGRLLYATGGWHPVKRWFRQLQRTVPQITPEALQKLVQHDQLTLSQDWEYELLIHLRAGHLSQEQVTRIIQGVLTEILVDISRSSRLSTTTEPGLSFEKQLQLLDGAVLLEQQQKFCQRFEHLPSQEGVCNLAPVIRLPEQLQARTNPAMFQTLNQLLDGKNTLWDLACRTNRFPLEILASLQSFISEGIIFLTAVPDLAPPVAPPTSTPRLQSRQPSQPLVACVDDSEWVCQTLDSLVKGAGYRFVSIQDGLRAVPALLTSKPDLILLDLRMPNTNGYEICTQLRKLTAFETTPILILTGNDGVIDRVRAKMAGATDFLSKSIGQEQLLQTLERYLVKSPAAAS